MPKIIASLSMAQNRVIELLVKRPMHENSEKATLIALEKKGYVEKHMVIGCDLMYHLTPYGAGKKGVFIEVVNYNYAVFYMTNGIQIRHNISTVQRDGDDYRLMKQYVTRDMEQEIRAVENFTMRASELCRAEMKMESLKRSGLWTLQ